MGKFNKESDDKQIWEIDIETWISFCAVNISWKTTKKTKTDDFNNKS